MCHPISLVFILKDFPRLFNKSGINNQWFPWIIQGNMNKKAHRVKLPPKGTNPQGIYGDWS